MLSDKASSNQFITIDILMEILYELITSRRLMKSRRKALFNMYNRPGLMGHEGDRLDMFVGQSNREMVACKMESFRCTDFCILIMINTLQSSDKNEEKLAKRLNRLYDSTESENRVLDIATMQQEVRSFWRTVKENRKLMFKGNGN